jgi:hypothetical protein
MPNNVAIAIAVKIVRVSVRQYDEVAVRVCVPSLLVVFENVTEVGP